MSARRYLKLSLLLPFVVPVIALGMRAGYNLLIANRSWGDLFGPRALAMIEAHLVFSLVFGGLPYLIFAILAWRWISRRPLRSSIVLLALSPLVVMALYVGLGSLSLLFLRDPDWAHFAVGLWRQVLLVGYSYVVVVLGIYLVLKGRCLSEGPSNIRLQATVGGGLAAD